MACSWTQAKIIDGKIHFRGLVASPDGQKIFRAERSSLSLSLSLSRARARALSLSHSHSHSLNQSLTHYLSLAEWSSRARARTLYLSIGVLTKYCGK